MHNITLEQFKEHFSNLMNIQDNNIDRNNEPNSEDNVFEELDVPFTEPELERGIRDLKRDKSTGFDNLMNEYLITGKAYLIPILGKLFNNIINTGICPELWVQSIIIPVFKKGDVNEPKNYRGISLVSHVGQLFTGLLNKRLLKWAEQHNSLTDAQFGFRQGFGSTDAIFALHSLITGTLRKGKRLYCCFVDYTRAFDSVTHSKLWQKLVRCGITGKLLNVIRSMYGKIKSCVKLNGKCSDCFECSVGLIQGESLFPPFIFTVCQ